MLIYVVMVEVIECMHTEPCRFYSERCLTAGHKTQVVLHPRHWARTEGIATTHLSRITNELSKALSQFARNKATPTVTGVVHVMIADTSVFQPLFNEAEQAACRIGGMDAVRTLRKSQLPPKPRKPRTKKTGAP